jgi:hypothetical protein
LSPKKVEKLAKKGHFLRVFAGLNLKQVLGLFFLANLVMLGAENSISITVLKMVYVIWGHF